MMKRSALSLFFLIAMAAATAEPDALRTLKGRIVEGEIGLPLTGARIGTEGGTEIVRSDWNGAFSLSLPDSPVSLRIELDGFEPEIRQIPEGADDLFLEIAMYPEIVEMDEVSVSAEADPAVPAHRFDAELAESIPTGGDPAGVAATLPQVNDYVSALGGYGLGSFPGIGGENPLRPLSPGIVYYGADPSWAASLWGYIPIPRTMHYLGYPSAGPVVSRDYIGETEVYDLVSPLRYGSIGSGLIRFVREELGKELGAGASMDSVKLIGGLASDGQDASATMHKSLFEFLVFPLEDMDRKKDSSFPYASSNYGRVKGNGGAAFRYGNDTLEGNRFGVDALAFYDSFGMASKKPIDDSLADDSHVFEGVDSFVALGLEDEATLPSGLSLNGNASISYQRATAEEGYRQDANVSYLLGTEEKEDVRAEGHVDLRVKPIGALNAELGVTYGFQWSSRELFNDLARLRPLEILESFRLGPEETPTSRTQTWSAVSHAIVPYAQATWSDDAWSAAASAGALMQPDRGLCSALADARFDLLFWDGAADLGLQLGLRSQPLTASALTGQSMFLEVDGYAINPASTQQKALSSGLAASWRSGAHECSIGGYFRYFYDLSGYSLQGWYPQFTDASDSIGGDAYLPSSELLLPESDQGRSFGGNAGYSGEYGQYSVSANYAFSDTRYHSGRYGWTRANSDARHVLKASFLYRPNQSFIAATNFTAFADTPFTPIVLRRNDSGELVPESGAPNSGSDLVPRFKLDVGISYRFSVGKADGRVYLDTCNLLGSLNKQIIGLRAGARETEGATTADYANRVYGPPVNGFSLLGSVVGIELRY